MAGSTPENVKPLQVSLETYWALNQQKELTGELSAAGAGTAHLALLRWPDGAVVWRRDVATKNGSPVEFQLPVGNLSGGMYRLHAAAGDFTTEVALGVRQTKPPGSPVATDYLQFVKTTVEQVIEQQTVRLGGRADGAPFITAGNRIERGYRSLGHKVDGKFQTYWFPERIFDIETYRMDIDIWPVLNRLTEVGGDARYREMLDGMIDAFARHGIEPRSGLGYFAEEADFDVRHARGIARGSHDAPKFKPSFSGYNVTLSLDRLFERAPRQIHRMARSTFWGLITDPQRMDYNRFCYYDFDDADRKHSQPPSTSHCAFDAASGAMIHLWSAAYAYADDAECLDWAHRLADKWAAVQHPVSGLVPNFFGAQATGETQFPMPGQWNESRGNTYAAWLWAEAAQFLARRAGGTKLAAQLTDMSRRLARGVLRYCYDAQRRVFVETLNLDGTPRREAARYCFRTQAEKDAAVAEDPAMKQVFVWSGSGFYEPATFWDHMAGSHLPWQLSRIAEITRDAELIELLKPIALTAVEESSRYSGPFTQEGRWTFRASGEYIRLLLAMHRLTRDGQFLSGARTIAGQEMHRISQIAQPDWWRLSDRAPLLDGLLELHAATR